jgi:hypothetical protein
MKKFLYPTSGSFGNPLFVFKFSCTKALTKWEGPKFIWNSHQKLCLFYSWQLRKRHHFWWASQTNVDPFYFVRALIEYVSSFWCLNAVSQKTIHKNRHFKNSLIVWLLI